MGTYNYDVRRALPSYAFIEFLPKYVVTLKDNIIIILQYYYIIISFFIQVCFPLSQTFS